MSVLEHYLDLAASPDLARSGASGRRLAARPADVKADMLSTQLSSVDPRRSTLRPCRAPHPARAAATRSAVSSGLNLHGQIDNASTAGIGPDWGPYLVMAVTHRWTLRAESICKYHLS